MKKFSYLGLVTAALQSMSTFVQKVMESDGNLILQWLSDLPVTNRLHILKNCAFLHADDNGFPSF